ncbi:MAG: hypothetical protein ACJ8HI_17920 [Massilia sp.]
MADTNRSLNAAREFFNGLIGQSCWSLIAGPGTGSMFTLALGEKFRRERPLKNQTLSLEQREFDGEFVVFVKESPWRLLDDQNRTICTCYDSNEANGPMLSGLQCLVGRSVVSASIVNENGGLTLVFGEGIRIELDGVNCIDTVESYSLFYFGNTLADVGCEA